MRVERHGGKRAPEGEAPPVRPGRWATAGSCALAFCATMAAALALGGGTARAAVSSFGSVGSGAGQFRNPYGIAIEQGNGDVYVVDRNNQRVERFTAEGAFLLGWGFGVANGEDRAETCTTACRQGFEGAGSEMEGAGQFAFPEGIAINNDPLSASYGHVYVVDAQNHRVEEFGSGGEFILAFGGEVNKTTKADVCTAASGDRCGAGVEGAGQGEFEGLGERDIAVDAEGHVYVGDANGVQRFNEGGVYEAGGLGSTWELAMAGPHAIYARAHAGGVHEYEVSVSGAELHGTELGSARDAGGTARAMATGPGGDLLIMDAPYAGSEPVQHILEYNAAGNEVAAFAGGEEDGKAGLAWGEAASRLYALNHDSEPERADVRVLSLPSPGPVLFAGSQTAAPVQVSAATLHAKVNPEGAKTSYHFAYGTEVANETATPTASLAASFEDDPVQATLEGLTPDTTYHFHVVAENANGSMEGPDETFTTPAAVAITSESATEVTGTAAIVEAQVNPSGVPASYSFQYWTGAYDAATAQSTPASSLAGGDEGVAVAASLHGLAPSTTYHWRVVGQDERGGVTYTVDGAEAAFTTQAGGQPLTLLDGRSWELVSPPDKRAGALEAWSAEGGIVQAAASGEAITYISRAATEGEPEGEPSPDWSQILSRHGAEGWSTRDIATRHEEEFGLTTGDLAEYRLFSPDLSVALVEPRGSTPLSASTSERTPYLRRQSLCEMAATASECFLPLLSQADVAPGVRFGGPSQEHFGPVRFDAASPDLQHVVLESNVPLLKGDTGRGLYEWSAGSLKLVSVLPGGAQAGCAQLGYEAGPNGPGSARGVISEDGTVVFWESCGAGKHHLYVSDTSKETVVTTQLDAVQAGASGSGESDPVFQLATGDGEHVFFSDNQGLTKEAAGGSLYECTITVQTGQPACALSDLTEPVNAGEEANVQGLIAGASEDGSYVYLVAHGVLSATANGQGETATGGADNLYEMHLEGSRWQPMFIGALSPEDAHDWAQPSGSQIELHLLSARVSPNGRWLAFMSQRPLTGYDNRDLNPEAHGARDQEVFLYDAATRRLACASCNPTGARPHGVFDPAATEPGLLVDRVLPHSVWGGHWLAGSVPNWTQIALDTSRYQPRYLANSGRLFFNSPEALVTQDTNGLEDVYEYEPPGAGSCTPGAATYAPASGGCVDLVSSGTSGEESAFLDASESGNDVFFLTAAKLVPQDTDTAFDVYDAHVCGSGWACAAQPPASQPPCESAAECKAVAGASASVFGSPASITHFGEGNLAPPGKAVSKSRKGRAKGKHHRSACRAKAKRIRNRKRRRRALMRCARRKATAGKRKHDHGARHRRGRAKGARRSARHRR